MSKIKEPNFQLYQTFHENAHVQKKIIGKHNFTYINIIEWLEDKVIQKDKKLKVLDYGCGVGTLSMYLSSIGYEVTGMDISPKAINTAKLSSSYLNIKNSKFYLFGTRKFESKFDLVTCIEVIEHVPSPSKTLADIYKSLKKNGYLFLSTPSSSAPLYKAGLLNNFEKKVGHLRRYSRDELISIIEKGKFKIIAVEEKEGILRNILYTSPKLGWIIRFIRGPISVFVTSIDNLLIKIFGESNYFVFAQKL
ncbi:MAG: methyltransferase domain-containing protein [Candidatus Paceibacterota bacterium]|jgi:ubiquinone biosynthesis O-methyltransferase